MKYDGRPLGINKSPHPFESANKVQNQARGSTWHANSKTVG